jgi:hypothetical protein
MTNKDFEQDRLELNFQDAIKTVWEVAQQRRYSSLELLAILRSLEHVHRQIRDDLFQSALPDNRQSLYKLLKDIEAKGGWPYIYRMKLKDLIKNLDDDSTDSVLDPLDAVSPPSTEL